MSTNRTTENFLKALESYNPPTPSPVIWRLYYDQETGVIFDLTTNDMGGDFIEISRSEADQNPHMDPYARVIGGELIYLERKKISTNHIHVKKLQKHDQGDIVTDDYNMLLLNKLGRNRWRYV